MINTYSPYKGLLRTSECNITSMRNKKASPCAVYTHVWKIQHLRPASQNGSRSVRGRKSTTECRWKFTKQGLMLSQPYFHLCWLVRVILIHTFVMVIHPCILHQSDFGKCINMMPTHAPKETGVGFFWEICSFMLKLCTNNIKWSNESMRASITLSRHYVKRWGEDVFKFVRNLVAGLSLEKHE
jgi:hypothetical protein